MQNQKIRITMWKNYKNYLLFILILIINEVVSKDIKMNLSKNSVQKENNIIDAYKSNKYYNNNDNNNNNYNSNNINCCNKTESSITSSGLENLTWDCAHNSSCLQSIAKNIIKNYENGENINFDIFSIEKLPKINKSIKSNTNTNNNNNNNKDNNNNDWNNDSVGRSTSSISEFFKENSVRIPIGPMVLNVQRSDDDSEFMEISLLGKRSWNETAQEKGVGRRHKIIRRRGKKHFQMMIPMYLAANAFGWTLLAVKAVTLLAIKAVLISKLAFLVASSIVIKSFMDNSHNKPMYPQNFPPPLTSYGIMDYGIHAAHSIPDAIEEQYQSHIIDSSSNQLGINPQQHIVAASNNIIAQHQPQHQQQISSGTSHHRVVYAIQANASHPQFYPLSSVTGTGGGNGPHIKRKDQWTGVRRPPIINSLSSKDAKSK